MLSEFKINAHLDKIAQVLARSQQRVKWFNISQYQVLSGKEGKPRAKAHLVINLMGEREVIETILAADNTWNFTVLYEMPEGQLKLNGKLKAQDKTHTLYTLEHQFTFNGLLSSVILMKSGFKRRSENMMLVFKKNLKSL